MSGEPTILIIIGSQNLGNILADAAGPCLSPKRQVHVIKYHYPEITRHRTFVRRLQRQPTISDIEMSVKQQMTNIAAVGSIAAILFVRNGDESADSRTSFPFTNDTCFLGFHGLALFQKLVIVSSSSDENDLEQQWIDFLNAGLRVFRFNGKLDDARVLVLKILAEPSLLVSEPETIRTEPMGSFASTVPLMDGESDELLPVLADNPNRRYLESARVTRRHPNEVVILLVGHSGHGKSKTINRLIGQELLEVGRSNSGSTTKVIQRVKVLVHNPETKVTITLAFDDTPGEADTNHGDRASNSALLEIYQQRYFPGPRPGDEFSSGVHWRTYPNVILLVASWDSIRVDAHNQPDQFTSAVGKSMWKLYLSSLVDHDRPNVIVVVTKSMSSPRQFDDSKSPQDKGTQWIIEAGKRRGIILELQRKVFPKSTPWQTVFVENEGGSNMQVPYRLLPDGNLSHQNLYDAIRSLIEHPGTDRPCDFTGMHALHALTGAEPLDAEYSPEKEILVDNSYQPIHIPQQIPTISPCENRLKDLTDFFLGVTYNPICGTFGRGRVLSLNPSDIQVCDGPRSQVEQFTMAEDAVRERKIDARKLGCHFDVPDLAGLSGHYASSHAYRASRSNDSQVYVAQHITAVAKIKPMSPHLSAEMLQAIKELPTWDQGPKPEYEEFFVNYGTHVVMSLALGGTLRIVVHHLKDRKAYDPRRDVGVAAIAPVLNKIGIDAGVAASYSVDTGASEAKDDIDINIFRDGGGSVASELTATLENYLKRARGRSVQFGCPESVRVNWVKALATDPTFCPDHTSTEFRWLHTLSGLTASQKNNLRQASEYYLKMRHGSPDPVPLNPGELPRKSNFQRVREKFTKIFGGRRNRGAGN